MSTWNKLDDNGKVKDLAEKMGWTLGSPRYVEGAPGAVMTPWLDGTGREVAWLEYWDPLHDWRSMGLVVEAMTEKGYSRGLHHYPGGYVSAFFSSVESFGEASNNNHNEPAATAEAAWKALDGE